MFPYPKITSQELTESLLGAPVRLGNDIFTVSSISPPDQASNERVITCISYNQPERNIPETLFLMSATKHVETVTCGYCGQHRHKNDAVFRIIYNYRSQEICAFCSDKKCDEKYFLLNPNRLSKRRN